MRNKRSPKIFDMVTKHLIISGRVQGVGYRNYMMHKARQFHITGWVRNRADGSVEAVLQGTPENVESLIVRAQHGPPHASVSGIAVGEAGGNFTDFVTRPTE
jgi:acylphosphatase